MTMKKHDLKCQYDGAVCDLVDSSVIYGTSYGPIYLCPLCKAYVGATKSGQPKGSVANSELRESRKLCHKLFDPVWRSKKLSRTKAYKVLSEKMELDIKETHFGMFGIEQCEKAIALIIELRKELEI